MLLHSLFGLVLLGVLSTAEQSEISKQTMETFDSNDMDFIPSRSAGDAVDYLIEIPRSQFSLLRSYNPWFGSVRKPALKKSKPRDILRGLAVKRSDHFYN